MADEKITYNPFTGTMQKVFDAENATTGALKAQEFTGDGTTTQFTVNDFNLNTEYQVIVSGVVQQSGHSRSGNVVTFTAAPSNGAPITILN